jgi:hypothetical protein
VDVVWRRKVADANFLVNSQDNICRPINCINCLGCKSRCKHWGIAGFLGWCLMVVRRRGSSLIWRSSCYALRTELNWTRTIPATTSQNSIIPKVFQEFKWGFLALWLNQR